MPKVTQEEWFHKEKGLKEEIENAEKLTEIECYNCEQKLEFYPDQLYWDSDGQFEFCTVNCPECNLTFEILASATQIGYEFISNSH